MKKYTVSMIANVTIDMIFDCKNEEEAKALANSMTYDQIVDEGVIRIYSTEIIEDQDIKLYTQE